MYHCSYLIYVNGAQQMIIMMIMIMMTFYYCYCYCCRYYYRQCQTTAIKIPGAQTTLARVRDWIYDITFKSSQVNDDHQKQAKCLFVQQLLKTFLMT